MFVFCYGMLLYSALGVCSVIQGCALRPVSDLQPTHAANVIVKFADDTYIVVPAVNLDSSASELTHVQTVLS